METKELGNGLVLLTSPTGIVDIRNGKVYAEAICTEEKVKFYEVNTDESKIPATKLKELAMLAEREALEEEAGGVRQ